ncbi:MAG: 50S ribosomal protein L29 [Bacteroidota bacterium]|jgi:large subunit ribosomal protein L29
MENQDIIALSTTELNAKLKEEKAGLVKLKLNHEISPIENPIKIRDSRKIVARLSTELTKRNKATK